MLDRNVDLAMVMPLIREKVEAGGTVRLSPKGTSMLPMLKMGRDSVDLVKPPAKLKKYDLPLYVRDDGSYILHRVVKVGDTYTCIGDNQYVYEEGVRPDQIIAVVTAFHHDGKRYSVKDLRYWLYCRYWKATRWYRKKRLKIRG